jgi:hypothetical protein
MLDEIGAELGTFLRQETGVHRQREFQQNGCISDRTEQLLFTNRVTIIVKQERILSTCRQLHLAYDGEIDATFVLLRNRVRFYLKRYVKFQKDIFPFFVNEVALRDIIGGVWYAMSAALIIGLPFFRDHKSRRYISHILTQFLIRWYDFKVNSKLYVQVFLVAE